MGEIKYKTMGSSLCHKVTPQTGVGDLRREDFQKVESHARASVCLSIKWVAC